MSKAYEELDFTDDFMFCKIMESRPELCRELLELILGKRLRFPLMPEKQKAIEITSDGKGSRLDVYVEDMKGVIYNIEMQATFKKDLPKRSRYYQSMIDLNIMERGADYSRLRKSYVIFICMKDCFGKGLHKYTFTNRCHEMEGLELGDEAVKIFLCAKAEGDDVSEEMKAFLGYLADRCATDKFTKKLDEAVEEGRKHEKWRLEYMTLLERDLENQEIGKREMKREMTRKLNAEKKKLKKKNEAEKHTLMERNEAEKHTLMERMIRRGKMTLEEIAEDMGVPLFEIQEVAKHM